MTKLQERDGHRYKVMSWLLTPMLREAANLLQAAPDDEFDRYDNPFESKYTLREKFQLPEPLRQLLWEFENVIRLHAETVFDVGLMTDEARHYAGLFKYMKDDRLSVHVDAGIHPGNGKRKHVTSVLYLSDAEDGDLELWKGTNCWPQDDSCRCGRSLWAAPELHATSCSREPMYVTECVEKVKPAFGRLVLFENNDYAWHGMAPYTGTEPRLVVTVSYLSNALDAFENKRQRAYFVPRPDEVWTPETYELRDKRADAAAFSEAYRASVKM